MIDGILNYPNGLTVAELKRLINDLPEFNDEGDPFEVWLGNGGYSNVATEICILNRKGEGGDLLISY